MVRAALRGDAVDRDLEEVLRAATGDGGLRVAYFVAADEEYRKRLRPYCTLTVHEAKDEAGMLADLKKLKPGTPVPSMRS